ncbi:hypothetical protein E2C01_067220 [Portunus trituberculatus]|uniref:Uncharacterized protein n=1 Tax=Portunus trituberculatus TaxID=210409 RepID=A0A5B7HUG1_PORTR|nr:hypothetical protein [Portunus trituberculatus]
MTSQCVPPRTTAPRPSCTVGWLHDSRAAWCPEGHARRQPCLAVPGWDSRGVCPLGGMSYSPSRGAPYSA